MNTRRILFWGIFIVILCLIVWGLTAAFNKGQNNTPVIAPAVTSADHILGNDNTPVTLVEYSDFQCPACEAYYSLVTRLFDESSSTVRLVYRHFPLPQHANAVPSALASEAAAAQGKFWPMYDQLFLNHNDWTEVGDPTEIFVGYAKKIGLNVAKFRADLGSSTLRDKVTAAADEANKIGLDHTPTFFVNGREIGNPTSYEEFKAIIDAAASSSSR